MLLRQIIIVPLRFLRSLIIIPLLPQSTIFLLKVISTWFGYLPRLMLGTNAVLGFYYPVAEATGDYEEQSKYVSLSWRFTLFASVIGAMAGIAISIFYVSPVYIPLLLIWGLSIPPTTFIRSFLQGKGDFDKIALIDVAVAISNFIFPLIGWFLFQLIGYIGGTLISFCIILYVGRREIFPKMVKITKNFAQKTIGDGMHFWLNGFLSDLAKSFEVTMFVILVGISKDFGGQYAVGMTLATIINQLMTSFSNVFQRRAIKQINEDKLLGYQGLINYIALDIILFTIFFISFIPAVFIIAYFLPSYASLIQIVPLLLFGVFYMRARFYPGVGYKAEKRFWEIHGGHIIHLITGIGIVLLIYYFTDFPNYYLASSQVSGAFLGAIILYVFFFKRNKEIYSKTNIYNLVSLLTILLFLLPPIYLVSNFWVLIIIELSIATAIIARVLKVFPDTLDLIRQLLNIGLLKRFF